MKESVYISATIVLFRDNIEIVKKTVNSFLNESLKKKLFLVDNSPTNELSKHFDHHDIEYIFMGKNVGFAAGHNTVIDRIDQNSKYHLILNPDVSFSPNVLTNLIEELEKHSDVAMIAPKVIFPSGEHQHSCRRYPSVVDLLARRLRLSKRRIRFGEYNDIDLSIPFYPDFIQGCFHLFRTEDFIRIKGFDERYFLYMEDIDICRKIDQVAKKKLYYPNVQITHALKKESSKSIRLFLTHLKSSFKYFKKWGF